MLVAGSMDGLLLLSLPESTEATSSNFNNLKSDSWKITHSVTRSTETGNKDLVVLVNERHTTILWDVGCDSLVVLLKLDSDTLSNSRVWLFSFNCDLFDDDTGSVGSLGERLLPLGSGVLFLVSFVGPPVINK